MLLITFYPAGGQTWDLLVFVYFLSTPFRHLAIVPPPSLDNLQFKTESFGFKARQTIRRQSLRFEKCKFNQTYPF